MTTASVTTAVHPSAYSRQIESTSADVVQMLLFTNGVALFAVPSDQVLEILYPHRVTALPFVAPAIDGLINVEGRIAVQVNLGTLTQAPSSSSRTELLLIETGRALCALKVDTVLSRTPVLRNTIYTDRRSASRSDEQPAALQELIAGYTLWSGNTVIVLDPARLGRLVRPEGLSEEGTGILARVQENQQQTTDQTTHCLVVCAAGERYALPLTTVVEIVEGGICTPIPGAPAAINGVFLLRDEVILVADLAARMGLTSVKTEHAGWFVVLDHAQGRCGFAFDEVIEIEQFSNSHFQPSTEAELLISGVFVVNGKNTLLLNADTLVNSEILAVLTTQQHDEKHPRQQQAEASLRFLEVVISGIPYAIPVETVKRVTPCFPIEVTHDTTGRIRGAIDLNGQIIPVLGLEYGLSLSHPVDEKEFVIFGDDDQDWAIGVDSAHRIVSIPKTQVNRLTQRDARYVGGVVQIDERLVSLLDFSVLSEHQGELP